MKLQVDTAAMWPAQASAVAPYQVPEVKHTPQLPYLQTCVQIHMLLTVL
jgi:hypothetical protein